MPRIVSWKEFCSLPNGTVFSEYEPCVVRGLFVRGDIINSRDDNEPVDFFYTELCATIVSPENEFWVCSVQRDGTYDFRDFLVYDADDVRKMIGVLSGVKQDG